ncbi:MAG: hypothetical protein LLG14_27275 [Nocardiaceae bacterium]|nr:hypothetical protein [Nocardiaceae bacterium]
MEDEFDYSAEADTADLQGFRDKMASARLRDSQSALVGLTAPAAEGDVSVPLGKTDTSANKKSNESLTKESISGVLDYVRNLPSNINLGLLDAAVNHARSVFDSLDLVGEGMTIPDDSDLPDPAHPGMSYRQSQMLRRREASDDGADPDFDHAYKVWRAQTSEDDSVGDSLTQGIAQFAIPFMGWSKAMGVARGAPMLQNMVNAAAAETITASTVLDPHAGRMADLVELGRHSEGKFGELLNRVSPDGSLANNYIEYMTERDGESEWEGRFKNSVDSLATSAAVAGLIKGGASTFKAARKVPEKLPFWRPSEIQVDEKGVAKELNTGLVFEKEADAQALVDELQHQYGPGFEKRMAEEQAKASDKNFATLHSFGNVLRANADKPVRTASLVEALERNIKGDTETGAFYKELLGRLKSKNLGGMTKVTSEAPGTSRGGYVPGSNAIKLYPNAFVDGPEKLLHTFTHEAVHAATVREVRASPQASAKIKGLFKRVQSQIVRDMANSKAEVGLHKKTLGEVAPEVAQKADAAEKAAKHYGFTDPEEFIAEIESNPEFRKLMRATMIDGESAWDKYRKAIGGILGIGALAMNPEFDKLMDPQDQQEEEGA